MRALRRYLLVPLFIAAALAAGGVSAHQALTPATHAVTSVADPICPAGTNWDDALQACV